VLISLLAAAAMANVEIARASGQIGSARAHFDRLDLQEGLSQSTATCILQDSQGFLWVGTEDGLNRYNGYGFTTFKPRPGDAKSLSNAQVWAIHEARDGALWVGTYGGLNRYDRATGSFTSFQHNAADPRSLSSNYVRAICEDSQGVLWVGTKDGLNRMLLTERGVEFERFLHDPADPASLPDDYIRQIVEDRAGNLWVGTDSAGLVRLAAARRGFDRFRHRDDDSASLSDDMVLALLADASGALWVGTNRGGLNRYDPAAGGFVRYPSGSSVAGALSSSSVSSLVFGRDGALWVGTHDAGLNYFDPRTGAAFALRHDPRNPGSLSSDSVLAVYVDRTGLVWAGTSHGLSKHDPNRARFEIYSAQADDEAEASSVRALLEDRAGVVWVGTRAGLRRLTGGLIRGVDRQLEVRSHVRSVIEDRRGSIWVGGDEGLAVIDPRRSRIITVRTDSDDPARLGPGRVWSLLEDRNGTIWAGTETELLELPETLVSQALSGRTVRVFHHRALPGVAGRLQGSFVRVLFEDRTGQLWVGTQDAGLFRLDRSNGSWVSYSSDPADSGSLSYPVVSCLHEDRNGVLWVGTYGGGLNRLDASTRRFAHITEAEGLPNNVIYGILEDGGGGLWLSSNRGLVRYDPNKPRDSRFRSYSVRDGLQSLEFNTGAFCVLRDGRLLFGGIHGINAFRPDLAVGDPQAPEVVLTGLRIANRELLPGDEVNGRVLLERSILLTRKLVLKSTDRVVSFEFAALHFAAPERNQYAYRMTGLEKDWNLAGTRRFATYASLPPSRYVFEVRAANPDGIWSERPATLEIVVQPPFWGTWWFRVLALAVVLAGVVTGHWLRTRSIHRRAAALEVLNRNLRDEMAERLRAELEKDRLVAELRRVHSELSEAYETTLEGWARILELRDQDTEGHTRRVTEMTDRLAEAMGLSEGERVHIRRGAILHDIGKIALPDALLRKTDPLSPEDRAIICEHPELARHFLESVDFLKRAIDVPYCHHERWDGTGYPRGLAGEQIPLAARIFAVVDVWDALSSDRPYRRAWRLEAVRAYLRDNVGTHFDPRVVEAFLELLDSNGVIAHSKAG
jgi:ligand-binding sensor domain-containing protein